MRCRCARSQFFCGPDPHHRNAKDKHSVRIAARATDMQPVSSPYSLPAKPAAVQRYKSLRIPAVPCAQDPSCSRLRRHASRNFSGDGCEPRLCGGPCGGRFCGTQEPVVPWSWNRDLVMKRSIDGGQTCTRGPTCRCDRACRQPARKKIYSAGLSTHFVSVSSASLFGWREMGRTDELKCLLNLR